MFERHTVVTDLTKFPFPDVEEGTYLFLSYDYGNLQEAFLLEPETIVDLDELLRAALPTDYTIEVSRPAMDNPSYAAIIVGRTPAENHVWDSCDFFIQLDEEVA